MQLKLLVIGGIGVIGVIGVIEVIEVIGVIAPQHTRGLQPLERP